jgi:hypothetical protein
MALNSSGMSKASGHHDVLRQAGVDRERQRLAGILDSVRKFAM